MSSNILQQVQEFIKQETLLDNVSRVVVGFSGGADSTAVLLMMKSLCPDIEAVHINHKIRGVDSDEDEAWCQTFCKKKANSVSFNPVRRAGAEESWREP